MQWNSDAVQLISSLERYTVLKAIEEGKRLVKKVMEDAERNARDGVVDKSVAQNAVNSVIEELEISRKRQHPLDVK